MRRAVVLDAAVQCFAAAGRTGTTIDEIAALTGVRKPAIYEMFGSKDDLYRAAVEHEVAALREVFRVVNAETAALHRPERTRRRIQAVLERARAHPAAFQLLTGAAESWPPDDVEAGRALRDGLVAVIADNYRRESAAAGTPIDAGADVLARLFFALAEQVVSLCLADPAWDAAALTDFLAEFIEAGLAGVRIDAWAALERARPDAGG